MASVGLSSSPCQRTRSRRLVSAGTSAPLAAASAPGFYYSPAFVEAGQGGLVWDAARIEALIADPEGFLGGRHRMRYPPIKDPERRAKVVAALRWETR